MQFGILIATLFASYIKSRVMWLFSRFILLLLETILADCVCYYKNKMFVQCGICKSKFVYSIISTENKCAKLSPTGNTIKKRNKFTRTISLKLPNIYSHIKWCSLFFWRNTSVYIQHVAVTDKTESWMSVYKYECTW